MGVNYSVIGVRAVIETVVYYLLAGQQNAGIGAQV